jgi:aldose 1-epimerase
MIHLQDGDLQAAIDPSYGSNVRSLRLKGEEFLWAGAERGHTDGIPLLAPWANRIDGLEYFANNRKYLLNPALANLRLDSNGLPIHGLVLFTDAWRITDQSQASATTLLEPWRRPDWMAQFPFAHSIALRRTLKDGTLEIETTVANLSNEKMPLSLGFHPYMQLTDSPLDEWRVHIAARSQVILSDRMIPTGKTKPIEFENPLLLRGRSLDHVFTDLTGDPFVIEGRTQRITIQFGPKFPVAIIYSPPTGAFVCIEPMASLTNAFNLDHAGTAAGLQHVNPGEEWRESFSITPSKT